MVFPAGLVLADTSAVHVAGRDAGVRELLENLAERYLLATCAPVDLELGQSARNAADWEALAKTRAGLLVELPLTGQVTARARQVQGLLAGNGLHRGIGRADLLIAAAAEVHGATVLHYDRDYDRIASISRQNTTWVIPPPSP